MTETMDNISPQVSKPSEIETDRLEALSDGVMAVIMTLMAFSLRVPAQANFKALGHVTPHILVYILSFAFLGIYWNNHHHLLRATPHIDGVVMWANLHLLFWLSLMPFATNWMAEHTQSSPPVALYGCICFAAALAYKLLVQAIIRANGRYATIGTAIGNDFKGVISVVIYLVGVGLAFVLTPLSFAVYAGVSIIWIIPDKRLRSL